MNRDSSPRFIVTASGVITPTSKTFTVLDSHPNNQPRKQSKRSAKKSLKKSTALLIIPADRSGSYRELKKQSQVIHLLQIIQDDLPRLQLLHQSDPDNAYLVRRPPIHEAHPILLPTRKNIDNVLITIECD